MRDAATMSFHLLRPLWLLALIPLAVVFAVLLRRQDVRAQWGGVIAPHLLGGTPGPVVSPEEQQRWDEYLAELDFEDRDAMVDDWSRADFGARKKLLGLLQHANIRWPAPTK